METTAAPAAPTAPAGFRRITSNVDACYSRKRDGWDEDVIQSGSLHQFRAYRWRFDADNVIVEIERSPHGLTLTEAVAWLDDPARKCYGADGEPIT